MVNGEVVNGEVVNGEVVNGEVGCRLVGQDKECRTRVQPMSVSISEN